MTTDIDLKILKFFLYTRKSNEKKERQKASIPDQIRYMTEMASKQGLKIVQTYQEEKSAFKPGRRPIFREMLQRIYNGEANGLLAWEFDRLSRNHLESGELQQLLQDGDIKALVTSGKTFFPEDSALLLAIEGGAAAEYSSKLSKNSRRGLDGKISRGDWGAYAPPGYLNETYTKGIIPDPDRFSLIRKIFDAFLTGLYSPPKLKKLLDDDGYRTLKHNLISRSGVYSILKNPFYAGRMVWKGKEYPGNHKPMITAEEFLAVQKLLGRKEINRHKTKEFPYSGLIRCAECGCMIVGEEKEKKLKGTGEMRKYIFYHCSQRKSNYDCSQKTWLREEDLETQIQDLIFGVVLQKEFENWAISVVHQNGDEEQQRAKETSDSQHRIATKIQIALDNLVDMRANDEITPEQFRERKDRYTKDLNRLKELVPTPEYNQKQFQGLHKNYFGFHLFALQVIYEGNKQLRKQLLSCLGMNLRLENRRLKIDLFPWFQPPID